MILHITVKPNSKLNQLLVDKEGAIKVKIKSPAIDGKANKALIAYLSDLLEIPKSCIELLSGFNHPHKKIKILSDETKISQLLEKYKT